MGDAGRNGPRCRCCYDDAFDEREARDHQRRYRRDGPRESTRALAAALAPDGAAGLSLIDIGGGIGSLQHLLLEAGAATTLDVDASGPYVEVAREEAERLGFADRTRFLHADFVSVEADVEPADIVGLDRVVCCYPDVTALVSAAARHARRRLGIVLPPDGPVGKAVIGLLNAWEWLTRSAFRAYAHRHTSVVEAAASGGLTLVSSERVGIWRMLVFERPTAEPAG
jgi:SAM-dependent methyltransferase